MNNNIQLVFIKWFPLSIFLSLMAMPYLLNVSALSKSIVPMLFIVWLLFIINYHEVKISKFGMQMLLLLLFGQGILWVSGDLKSFEPMLLGAVWVMVAFLLLNTMYYVKIYMDTYMYSFLVVAVLWAVLGSIVWLGLTDGGAITFFDIALTHSGQTKPAGPFSNGNVFGVMMVCAWIISTKFWLETKNHGIFYALLSFFFLIWVFSSMSRGAWLAGAVVYLLLLLRLMFKKEWLHLTMLLISITASWLIASEMVNYVVRSDMLSSQADSLLNAGARQILYPSVFEVWREHWLFGVGFGNLTGSYLTGQASAFSYLPIEVPGMGATSSAHNHLLHILAEAGLIGLLAWLIVSLLVFRAVIANRMDHQSKAWTPLSIALVFWIQGLFNISMTEVLPFLLFFMFLGLGLSLQHGKHQGEMLTIPKLYFSLSALCIVIVLFIYSQSTMVSWKLYERMIYTQEGVEKGKLVGRLFREGNNNIYPYVINSVVYDFMATEQGEAEKWALIQPNIEHALALEEWPALYQALFYTHMLNEEWDKACDLGKFLKQQQWLNDENINAYDQSCQQKGSDSFRLGM